MDHEEARRKKMGGKVSHMAFQTLMLFSLTVVYVEAMFINASCLSCPVMYRSCAKSAGNHMVCIVAGVGIFLLMN